MRPPVTRIPIRLLTVMLCLFAAALLWLAPARAQDAEEKSTFTRYVENTLSSDNFQISLNGLEGTLSSDVSLTSITIADRQGIWLTIENPKLVWSRAALLSGRVDVDSLTATRIIMPRGPLPDESAPAPEATPFKLPDIPVAILLRKLKVDEVEFGETVFGLASKALVEGKLALDSGELDLDLSVVRLDGPGGALKALASFDQQSERVKLDVTLTEPQNGIVANLLNLEGTPPVALTIKGDAPLADLDVDITFDVAEKRILAGNVELDREAEDTLVKAVLAGPLSEILPQQHRAFFGDQSNLNAQLKLPKAGGWDLQALSLKSGALDLTASARSLTDGFLSALDLQFTLSNVDGSRVALPVSEGQASVDKVLLNIDYNALENNAWRGTLQASGFEQKADRDGKPAGIKAQDVTVLAQGTVDNIQDALNRAVGFTLSGQMSGFDAEDPALSEALGQDIKLAGQGSWTSGQPLDLTALTVNGDTFRFAAQGRFAAMKFDGDLKLEANRLAAFSTLADRSLRGRANLGLQGEIDLLSAGFDLKVDGTTTDLEIAQKNVDPLLKGVMTLSGTIERDEQGLSFDTLRLASNAFNTVLQGRYSSALSDVQLDARIRDLADVTAVGSGALTLNATVKGQDGPLAARVALSLPDGALQGRQTRDLIAGFEGTLDDERIRGELFADGSLNGRQVQLSGSIDRDEAALKIENLAAEIAGTRLNGTLARSQSGLLEGDLAIDSAAIGDAAALALLDATGAVEGTVKLFPTDDMQSLQTNIAVRKLRYEAVQIGSGTIVAAVVDVFGKPRVGATIEGTDLRIGGNRINTLEAKIETSGDVTGFDARAALSQNDARVTATGSLRQGTDTMEVRLATLTANTNIANLRLTAPATITRRGDTTRLSDVNLAVGSGTVRLSGSAGATLALNVDVQNLPLALANTVQPGLGAGGTLNGSATIGGTTSSPSVRFTANGSGLTVTQIANAGLTPLNASASGEFANRTIVLNSARASNSQQLSVDANGRIPLQGQGLSLRVSGSAPLALAESSLASRGASLSGVARFDLTATGALSDPRPSGLLSIEGASLTDPLSNLKLTDIGLLAGLSGDQLTINRGSARLSSGGTITMSGGVGLSGDLPANISIALNNARYTDGKTFDARASGQLSVTGQLLQSPLLGGTITLERTEITVPETFGNGNVLLEVDHVNPSRSIRATLDRLARSQPKSTPRSRPSILRLDLTINAPNQIFVRGRGLDAELGGRIRITGPVTNVSPQGRFDLRRGRLSILGQRIDLTEGSVSLTGDLDPMINLTAKTRGGDVDAFITLQGRASDIKVTFSSSPELPQDEVLARILFGRGVGDLSPAQIARLAAAAAELTGGNSPGLVSSIRTSTGLDDLDVVQDRDGNAAVKAGKYISDNVYLGVQAGSKSEATINLDITDGVKARGAVNSEGDASIGIFLEKDY